MEWIRIIKPEIRIVGFDDSPFSFGDKDVLVTGAIFRGGSWLDGVITCRVEVDGTDSTKKIIATVNGSPHKKQLRVIMLDGITFGGFNVVDMDKLCKGTGLPVIAVVRDKPDFDSIRKALSKFDDREDRWKLIEKAGDVKPLDVKNPQSGKLKKIWFQTSGIDDETARKIIRMSSTRSFVPEPLRVAHLIGHGVCGCK
jgi:endonuclease V-like protein UPF0215 family